MNTSETNALLTYFGLRAGQTRKQFLAEVRALSPAEKSELSRLAAQALGLTVADEPQRQLQSGP